MNSFIIFIIKIRFLRRIFLRDLINKFLKIKIFVFDVDGVLTDGKILISENGNISKNFNAKDGLAIKLLLEKGLKVVFLSGSESKSIKLRADQLGINKCIVGAKNKENELNKIQKEFKLNKLETAFIGDDFNDLNLKNSVSLLISPRDAINKIKSKSDLILFSKGGEGVASEITQLFLQLKK